MNNPDSPSSRGAIEDILARSILDTLREPLVVLDADLRVKMASPSFYQTFHVTPAETENRLLYELGNRQWNIPKLRALLEEILPQNTTFNDYEVEQDFPGIGHRAMLLNARRVHGNGNRPDLILLALEDVTERRNAEEKLRESEKRFRALVTASSDVVYCMSPDWSEMRHLQGRQFIADTNEPSGTWLDKYIHPDDQPRVMATINEAIRTKSVFQLEHRVRRVDGTLGWTFSRAIPIRDASGEIVEWFGAASDVTDRKQAEENLHASEARYRFVLDSMAQKIFTAKPNGDVDYFNPVWMEFTGLSFEQIRDWGWTQFIHPDDVDENVRVWQHSLDTGEPFQLQHRFRRADGAYRWHISRAVPMRDSEGRIIMWIGSNTDIHEQKQAEDTLRQLTTELSEANRSKDEFLSILAHELRNPLAPLRNGLQILRLARGNAQAIEQTRSMMERQLHHLVRLVDDLLDISRISRGKIVLKKERVELATIVDSALEASEPTIQQHGQELSVLLPEEPIYVDADKTRLAQALCNLLSNACKYSDKGNLIELTVQYEGNDAVLRVKDNGIGIPAHMISKIFDMFTQVDRSLEKSQGGLGIGLSLVKRLVEMHGGSVEAHSEGHGMGSEFLIRLPIVLSVTQAQQEEPDDRQLQSMPRRRILVVDDNVDAASSLAMMLKIMGHEVRTAHDGLEGVDVATAYRPDLILLDIGMPKLNGYEACRRIREQPWGKGVVLVALTGWGQDEDRRRSQEAGFNHHLVKPVEPAALEKLLAGLKSQTA